MVSTALERKLVIWRCILTRNLGPGGSGFEFVYRRGKQLSEIVGDGYHLLSFDPRGINGSTPEALCYPSGEARQQLSPHRDEELIHDSPETFAWTQNYVKACAETMDEHGAYINTPQTAADMNSILDAVGQQDMAYWGFSYGTVLGQTYAGLFPERSRRVIIDGVVNNFVWYGNWFDGEQFANTEDVLDGFFDECIKAGRNCSLSSQADTKEELHDLVFGLLDDLKEQPISVYLNNSNYGLLDYSSLMYGGIFPALYKPASWYSLAENIAKLINGNATDAWLAYAQNGGFGIEGDGNSFVTHNDGLTGAMSGLPMDRKALLKEIIPLANDSLFSPTEYGDYYIRQQWGIPRTHNFTQKQSVRTAHPLLVLSTSYDPICPLISAKSAYRAFQGSALIEVKGYGHCSVAVASTCLAKHVREFLYNGTLPDGHVTCDVDGSYFVKPEADGKMIAQMSFEDTEDEKIHLAQLELARDWDWRV